MGHAGTLDPFATGVLLLCLGQATRVSEYLMDAPKLYRALIRFGVATDTYDATGHETATAPVPSDLDRISALLPSFTGHIRQTPPAYSALKIAGVPAYRRARRGEAVVPEARIVEVYRLEVRSWTPPDLDLEVECGRGTYVRSLAHDLGQAAGSAAHLAALQRRAVGPFRVEQATSLPELEALVGRGDWRVLLHPLDEALLHVPALIVGLEDASRLQHGQPLVANGPAEGLRRIYGPQGRLVALVEGDPRAGLWRPHKVFPCA